MIKSLIIIPIMIFLVACSVSPTEPALNPTKPVLNPTEPALNPTEPALNPPEPALNPTEPVTNETPVISNSYQPRQSDTHLIQGNVFLDSSEILTLESYPLQFTLHLKGSLPTPCHKLRVVVQPPDAQNQILIEVYSVVDPDKICIQVLEPFEISVPLGSYSTGKYTIYVNGEVIAEFQS